jgi:hypothetical protein
MAESAELGGAMLPHHMSKTARQLQQGLERRRLEDAKRRGGQEAEKDPLYFEYDQAARLLGCAPTYVRWLCSQGKLGYIEKTYRHGVFRRRVRKILRGEIARYLAEHLKLTLPKVAKALEHQRP